MARNILAVVVGWIAGMAFNMAIVMINIVLYPMPEGVDFSDTPGMVAFLKTLPILGWLVVLVAHVGQAFFGGLVASRISRTSPMTVSIIVGVITMVGGILNALTLEIPAWMWIEIPLYLIAAYAAASFTIRRRAAADGP